MKISDLGLGTKAEELFKGEGVETLFPPQEQAVKAGVMEGKSLVVCTPTASGKTVIAELAALSAVKKAGQVVYVVPLRALASEKFKDFKKWEKLGFSVELQMGDLDAKFLPQKNTADILVATAEKCDSILRSRPNWFRDVKLLVIDEIHLITTDRGPTYEILIAKFKKLFKDIQLLGLSATIGNADELAEWLGAELLTSDWRPVKLTQRLVTGKSSAMISEARKTMKEGAQSLVFVNSRRSAEAVADLFAEELAEEMKAADKQALKDISEEILDVLSPPTAQCRRLANAVKGGAAFHHAGIVNKQRELIEEAFKAGRIKVITATPTLAAGVNLPARKVIIRDIKRYSESGLDYIPVLEYLQMCLPYDAKLVTNKGILPIGEIVKQKLRCTVLSFNDRTEKFEFRPVQNYYNCTSKRLVELVTNKGYRIRLTEEHPLRVGDRWKPAKDIEKGDEVIFRPYAMDRGVIPDFFDFVSDKKVFVGGLGRLITKAGKRLKKTDKELASELGMYYKILYHYKNDIKNMPLPYALKLLDILDLKRNAYIKRVKSGYGSFLNLPNEIDEDSLWLAGIIATDGNIQRTVDKRTKSEYIKIRVFNKNRKIVDKSRRILERLVSGKVYFNKRDDGLYVCEIGCTLLAKIFQEHFGIPFKEKTESVTVPPFLLSAPNNLIGAYLSGVLDGDGSYTVLSNKRFPTTDNQRVLVVSGSKKFAEGVQELLLKLGIVSMLYCEKKTLKVILKGKVVVFKKPNYYVTFHRKSYIKIFAKYANSVRFKFKAKYNTYHNLDEYYCNADEGVKLRVIQKNSIKLSKEIDVYNIGVRGNENYIASGFLVHNCGRAGRPKYDKEGESVLLATNDYEAETLERDYINGYPENIQSQLGVEPTLRMHVLASIASGFTPDRKSLFDFFGSTFFAYEYGTEGDFRRKVERILRQLGGWGFIKAKSGSAGSEFVSAAELSEDRKLGTRGSLGANLRPTSQSEVRAEDRLIATPLGARVSELYIDPETAHDFVLTFEDKERIKRVNTFGLLELLCATTELRPLLRVSKREEDEIWGKYYENEGKLLTDQKDSDYLDRFKTALMLGDWIDEKTEDSILETYGLAPGIQRVKLDSAEWLAYSCSELVPYMKTDPSLRKEFQGLQMRLKHGIKEELMPLVAIRGVGRVRARKLFNSGLKTKTDLQKADVKRLGELVGRKVAENIKKELS